MTIDRSKSRLATVASALGMITFLSGVAAAGPALDKVTGAGKITFCSDLSAPPFIYLDADTSKPAGFDVDIGIALAKEMGVTADYKNMAFDGLIPSLQAGQCDAILSSLYDKPARREVVDFVDYAIVGNAVIVKDDSAVAIKTLADLSGKKVAAERGSVNEDELNQASAALTKDGKTPITVVPLPKITDATQQLLAGLVDAFYAGTVAEADFNKKNTVKLKLAGPQVSSFPTGIATVKSASDLHDAIDAAFAKMQKDGSYAAIVTKWGFEGMAIGS